MAGRGVLFALTTKQEKGLLAAAKQNEDALLEIIEEIEEAWDEVNLEETDKAWEAIHRCLSNGTTNFDGGTYPRNQAILGGQLLHNGEDYIVVFVAKNVVRDVASSLQPITESWFREQYFGLITTDFPRGYIDDESFKYTWTYFQTLCAFYQRTAIAERSIVFTVDP